MQIKTKTSRFTKQVFSDEHSAFISNPEYVAEHMAQTIFDLTHYKSGVELCCCIGANAIQLAKKFDKVIGVDLSPERIKMARKNAAIYDVTSKTEFIVGDVLNEELLKSVKADFAVLDPEWSTRKMDRSSHVADINLTTPSLKQMFQLTKKHITPNIIARVPRTFNFATLAELGKCKLENVIIHDEIVFKNRLLFANFYGKYRRRHSI